MEQKKQCKILHIATVDTGGAYKAVERIQSAMRMYGMDSDILLRNKQNADTAAEVYCNTFLKRFLSKVKNVWNMAFARGEITRDLLGNDITGNPFFQEADIIFIHWINSFLSYHSLKKILQCGKKVIFIMHDMWLFTGGCHCNVKGEKFCEKYKEECGNCPLVGKNKEKDVSYRNLKDKQRLFKTEQFVVCGPSRAIVECAKNSTILKGKEICYLPNCYDDSVFYNRNEKEKIRRKWKINTDKTILLFGTSYKADENENKGIRYLAEALLLLPQDEFLLIVFGESKDNYFMDLKMECIKMGFLSDERKMSELYNLADIFLSPSKQESFGFTVCESMACGTPVVAFPAGGICDQITHKENGYLAKMFSAKDIAAGILYCKVHQEELSLKAQQSAKRFTIDNVGKEWMKFFHEI